MKYVETLVEHYQGLAERIKTITLDPVRAMAVRGNCNVEELPGVTRLKEYVTQCAAPIDRPQLIARLELWCVILEQACEIGEHGMTPAANHLAETIEQARANVRNAIKERNMARGY